MKKNQNTIMIHQIKKFKITLILLVFTGIINAQSVNVDIATERNLMSKSTSAKVDADGSPYIEDVFLSLKIDTYTDMIYTGRYNAYNDEMEVKIENGKIVALDNKNEYTVTFTNKNKIYKTYNYTTKKGVAKRGFLVVVKETEKYSLLKREHIKYQEGKQATSSYQKDKPASFKRESDTYFLKLGNKIMFLPQKKKSFLKAFPKKSSDLKSYIKKNKINLKKEEDLKKIVKYLSEL
jgi:uncharacterized protein with FMN-binding domain